LVRYWDHPDAVADATFRESIRDMLSILGALLFKMVIWVG
jgi:hypothetical protein